MEYPSEGIPGAEEEAEIREKTRKILEGLENRREHPIPLLREIQVGFGYLPHPSMIEVATFWTYQRWRSTAWQPPITSFAQLLLGSTR